MREMKLRKEREGVLKFYNYVFRGVHFPISAKIY